MTRDGDVDVLGPKNALLRAFPINDLGAQSLSSFQRSVGPVKPGGPFSTILRLPLVGAAKNHQWGPVSGCYDSFWPRILSVKRWIWTVNENCHNDSAPQQWPKLPMDSLLFSSSQDPHCRGVVNYTTDMFYQLSSEFQIYNRTLISCDFVQSKWIESLLCS